MPARSTTFIRRYEPSDAEATREVFRRAVHGTAARDYDPDQLAAWTSGSGADSWPERRMLADTWVAELAGEVVGFTDVDAGGYVDMMFVDPSAGGRGVASALLSRVRRIVLDRGLDEWTVHASLTARPLFERHGFAVAREQRVERAGVELTNFVMRGAVAPKVLPGPGSWLPAGFEHPLAVEWRAGGEAAGPLAPVRLRPIAASDVHIDMPAVMGNREVLWAQYGQAWGWPPATLTADDDAADLQRHADEMVRHESFNYAVLPWGEGELFGCLYLDPLPPAGRDGLQAEVSWWLTPAAPAGLRAEMPRRARRWLEESWPFAHVHLPFNGR